MSSSIAIKEISDEEEDLIDDQTASLIRLRSLNKNTNIYDKYETNNYEEALSRIGN